MKITFSLLFFIPFLCYSQHIDSLKISSGNTSNSIDVELITIYSMGLYYNDDTTYLSNDTIFLEVCYSQGLTAAITRLTDTFNIVLPSNTNNFTLVVKTKSNNANLCIGSNVTDSDTITFSFPLVNDIHLNTKHVLKKEKIYFYPSPARDLIRIDFSEEYIQNVVLYDLSGNQISIERLNVNTISLKGVNNGVYIIAISTSKGILMQKIVVSR